MTVNWEDYLKEVMPEVKGCPIRTAINAIRNSAIEFCEESRSWRDPIADITTVADTPTYPLVPPADSEILALYWCKLSDENYPLSTYPEAHRTRYHVNPNSGTPRWFDAPTPDEVTFIYTPDDIYTVNAKAILKPTRDSILGPDWLYKNWLEQVAHGALARLKAQKSRQWGDSSMVSYHRREFINGWVEARVRDTKSNVQSGTTVKPGYFGTYRGSRSY